MLNDDLPQGVVRNKEGESVILLPPGPIRLTVDGSSGIVYQHTLHDNPQAGHPIVKLEPVRVIIHPPSMVE